MCVGKRLSKFYQDVSIIIEIKQGNVEGKNNTINGALSNDAGAAMPEELPGMSHSSNFWNVKNRAK